MVLVMRRVVPGEVRHEEGRGGRRDRRREKKKGVKGEREKRKTQATIFWGKRTREWQGFSPSWAGSHGRV